MAPVAQRPPVTPDRIFDVGFGFWPAKALLSAVELGLFTVLGREAVSAAKLAERLGLHARPCPDFLDGLVALGLLERDGQGDGARYRNTAETALFLDRASPAYVGGLLEMANARLYPFWGRLTDALRTGEAQNEIRDAGRPLFDALYADPERLEVFMAAMAGASLGPFTALAEMVDFSTAATVADVGGATGQLCTMLARRHPHLRCVSFDLPPVEPIAKRAIAAAGVEDRVTVASGDFFCDPLPVADVIVMSMILHDWDLDHKLQLIRAAYRALPEGGRLIAVDNIIDDDRRENVFGLMMSLNMLIETATGFDYTGHQLREWCQQAGFRSVDLVPLAGPATAGVAHK